MGKRLCLSWNQTREKQTKTHRFIRKLCIFQVEQFCPCVCVCVCVCVWERERERERKTAKYDLFIFQLPIVSSSPLFQFLPVSPLPFQALSTSQSQSQSHLFSLFKKKKIIPLLSTSSVAVIYFFVTATPKLSDLIPIFLWVRGAVPLIVLLGLTQVILSDRQSDETEGPRWPYTGLVSWCDCQMWQFG